MIPFLKNGPIEVENGIDWPVSKISLKVFKSEFSQISWINLIGLNSFIFQLVLFLLINESPIRLVRES